jgi:hypothetical protein
MSASGAAAIALGAPRDAGAAHGACAPRQCSRSACRAASAYGYCDVADPV